MQKSNSIIKLNPRDNVGISRNEIPCGSNILYSDMEIVVLDNIPATHKVSLTKIEKGDEVIKYGQVIGFASATINKGEHVHSHNLEVLRFSRNYNFGSNVLKVKTPPDPLTFMGIRRKDGRVATRNYIAVISTVNCSATVAKKVSDHFKYSKILENYPNVDGVVPITHSFGCCIDHNGEGLKQLQRTISGFANHVNFAGVVIIGLGCEANQLKPILDREGLEDKELLHSLIIQEIGGTQRTIDAAVDAVNSMLDTANNIKREPLPLSHIKVALQCGGSDGYSGLTANPALGKAVDILVAHGATAILTETPEIYGAEHLLTQRAINRDVGEKLIERIRWWEEHAERENGSIDNNPTPGNKAGGLTTIYEKSLGAVAKSGTTPLNGVYLYAEPITESGLVFMDAPGYDPMGITGQIASGANIIAFTTGRGSCFGGKPSPSIKISTNTPMYERMLDDMDLNCGSIMDGVDTVDQKGQEIFDHILRVASGEKSKSEILDVGDEEFVPWMIGAQM